MGHITVKRTLDNSDWLTLLPILVAFGAWFAFKGVRYVP